MKKILFLLLSTIAMYGQVPADATPLENIQITNNTTDNSATKVNVQSTDGTINTISKSDLVNVVEVNDVPSLPLVGEVGKIYVVKNVNKIYRWNGTFYQELAVTNDSDVVKLTGNQTISGQKSFSLTGKIDMQTNNGFPAISVTALGSNVNSAAEFINNSSSPYSTALNLQTGLSGGVGNVTLSVLNSSPTGTGIVSNASNGGVSISSQSGNGDSYISNITSGGTGRNYVGRNNGIETYSVDKIGNVLGNSYIKRSTPATNILLAGGTDITQASLPVSTATQTALNGKENTFSKNTAFNKNFGTTAGTVAEGNDSRINNGQTAFGWGNHAGLYPSLTGAGANGTWGINISGSASSATNWGGIPANFVNWEDTPQYLLGSSAGVAHYYSQQYVRNFLDLGSNAYSSTAYLPLTGGTLNGKLLSSNFEATGTMKMKEYTVATLPTPTGTAYATVTDALAPTYMATVVGGGAVVTPVFYNGTAWVSH